MSLTLKKKSDTKLFNMKHFKRKSGIKRWFIFEFTDLKEIVD